MGITPPPSGTGAASPAGLGPHRVLPPEFLAIGWDEALAAVRAQALQALDDVHQAAAQVRAELEVGDDARVVFAASIARQLTLTAIDLARHTAALHALLTTAQFARPQPLPAAR